MSVPFSGKFQLLNEILDQFVDCKFIIHYYRRLTVHKLVKNCIQKFFVLHFYGLPLTPPTIDAPLPTAFLLINHRAPGGQNWKKKQWLPPLGRHGPKNLTISAKFKFLNVTLDKLLDCNVIMHDYRHIAVHQLV